MQNRTKQVRNTKTGQLLKLVCHGENRKFGGAQKVMTVMISGSGREQVITWFKKEAVSED